MSDLKTPPKKILGANRVADGQFDIGMFKAQWEKANATLRRFPHVTGRPPRPSWCWPAAVPAPTRPEPAHTGPEPLDAGLIAGRAALEGHLASALNEAEAYAKLSRRSKRAER